jgi:hypothetical protein
MPGLNASIDAFVAEALEANLAITVVNHATGAHAFDLTDDSAMSRTVIEDVLSFLRASLA